MLGLLLARAGIKVLLIEKHVDFFRDFRGDTIHPSTLDLIDQLGLRNQFDAIPHASFSSLDVVANGTRIRPIDLRTLPRPNRTIDLMPQWDFLDLLVEEAKQFPSFHLLMGVEVTGLLWDANRVTGVTAEGPEGAVEVNATLTVAADGRTSTVRAESGLVVEDYGVPIDVLWFRLPMPAAKPPPTLGYLTEETFLVTIPRMNYFQTAMLIPKGGFEAVRDRGIAEFRASVLRAASFLKPVVGTIRDWDQIKLLSVQINRLKRWHLPGLLCIGDAAHAMSPAFGVGINYAIQDAVAAANLLARPLAAGTLTERNLTAVQRRRLWPVRRMQSVQLALHRRIARPGGGAVIPNPMPAGGRLLLAIIMPILRPVAARIVGRGFRPERISAQLLANDRVDTVSS
ncbi:MAG: monooxygenase [Glaciihabitans sp.]|nr:monooxygenase [Glaciihabitans sp.]